MGLLGRFIGAVGVVCKCCSGYWDGEGGEKGGAAPPLLLQPPTPTIYTQWCDSFKPYLNEDTPWSHKLVGAHTHLYFHTPSFPKPSSSSSSSSSSPSFTSEPPLPNLCIAPNHVHELFVREYNVLTNLGLKAPMELDSLVGMRVFWGGG